MTSQAVIDEGANFLRLVAPTFGFIGIMRAYTGGFRGAWRDADVTDAPPGTDETSVEATVDD
jgi:hypothetical protein